MLQNSKFFCGLFCVMVELVITEGAIFRRPLNSSSSVSTDGSGLTAAHCAAQLTSRLSLQRADMSSLTTSLHSWRIISRERLIRIWGKVKVIFQELTLTQ